MDTAKVLLENEADVNLDFDSMTHPGQNVCAMDVLLEILSVKDSVPEEDDFVQKYQEMEKLLLQYGAKTYADLQHDEL